MFPKLANTCVDDTVGWATGHNKADVAGRLRYQVSKMITWCANNKIKINADKTHIIFNEYDPEDNICVDNIEIKTTKSVRYLGAELLANDEIKNSTFLIDTSKIANLFINDAK